MEQHPAGLQNTRAYACFREHTYACTNYVRTHVCSSTPTHAIDTRVRSLHNMLRPQVGYTYLIAYCHANGLVRTHKAVETLKLYIFYGKYRSNLSHERGRLYDVMRGLHKTLTSPRRRFASRAEDAFPELISLLDCDPKLKELLKDRGVGTAPVPYLAAVETGLRRLGKDIHAMGTNVLTSKDTWSSVPVWRKTEAYIAIGRFILGSGTLRTWTNFKWEHYAERTAMAVTFRKRHYPLSDGIDHFQGQVEEPAQWSKKSNEVNETKKPMKKKIKVEVQSKPATGTPKGVMVLDPETGEFVMVKES